MKTYIYKELGETIYKTKSTSGLQLFLLPKEDMHQTHIFYMVNFGSIDQSAFNQQTNKTITFPAGIAHFIEHLLFEKKAVNIFQAFTENGANANAFTSLTKTAYYVSATEKIAENIKLLLTLVQEPYFTDDLIQKEKGIITQEIRMYNDNPHWQAHFHTIKNLFHHSSFKEPIAGTELSVQQITKKHLVKCYKTFYKQNNMALFITGNFSPNKIVSIINNHPTNIHITENPYVALDHSFVEPEFVVKENSVYKLPVSIPKVVVGIKESQQNLKGNSLFTLEFLQKIALKYFFSPGGLFYNQLMNEQLIDDSFYYDTSTDSSFNFSVIGSNSDHPEKLADVLRELLHSTSNIDLDEQWFHRLKAAETGTMIQSMNSLSTMAKQFTQDYFSDLHYFEKVPMIYRITFDDFTSFVKNWITKPRLTTTIIKKNS